MKYRTYIFEQPHQGKRREPLMQLSDLAFEAGVCTNAISNAFRFTTVPHPKPVPNVGSSRRSWYRGAELRDWWKKHNEAKQQEKAPCA